MQTDVIEQALRKEPTLTASPGLAPRVMRAVRRQAAQRQAIAFPLRPLAAGLIGTAALTVGGLVAAGSGPGPAGAGAPFDDVAAQLALAVAWLATTLAGSFGVAWWSLRLGARR